MVADQPFDEDAAKLLRSLVERLVVETPPRPDPAASLPPELAEASKLLSEVQDEPAEIVLRNYLAEHPDDVRGMAMMAEIAGRCDFFDDAHRILTRALQIDPNSVDALLGLAKLLNHVSFLQQGSDRGDEALEIFQRALEIDPSNVDVVSLHSSVLVRFRRVKESVLWYDRLLALDPTHWLAWANYGSLLNSLGHFGQSIAALRMAAAINPKYGLAWWEIANLKISKLFDCDVERMEEVLERSDRSTARSQAHIHFALAKAFDQAGRFEQAADISKIGNDIKRELEPYDPEKVTSDVENSETDFHSGISCSSGGRLGQSAPDPIFIVGMQRAGTTLVEQILSSHSQIEGTEELFFILSTGHRNLSSEIRRLPGKIGPGRGRRRRLERPWQRLSPISLSIFGSPSGRS